MSLQNMNIVQLTSLSLLIYSTVAQELSPPHMKIKVRDDDHIVARTNLIRTKRALANEHLPIWMAVTDSVDAKSFKKMNGRELVQDYKVMEQLGEFTIYQDAQTLSAAIYFHKRREIDGVIGSQLYIRNLPIDKINYDAETLFKSGQDGIYVRSSSSAHDKHPLQYRDETDFEYELTTYENRLYKGYPELLIIVSYDLAVELCDDVDPADCYTAIVSYVLSLFNAVDMLYSKLKATDIQINIAGIVIEAKERAFRFVESCKLWHPHNGTIEIGLDANCILRVFPHYFREPKNRIRMGSYDVIVYLTSKPSYEVTKNSKGETEYRSLAGLAKDEYHAHLYRILDNSVILCVFISISDYPGDHVTIAHELAHIINVKHDSPSPPTSDAVCCSSIMKTHKGWCDKCISWSRKTERALKKFFSSHQCCIFINYPQSLGPPGRRVILTADEQCRCSGYKSLKKSRAPIFFSGGFCTENLNCDEVSEHFDLTPIIPLDGTPCGKQKVCWRNRCEKIDVSDYPHD